MARKRELTWVTGSDGRRGRWRKKYRGKLHYFDGGRNKSDEAAYKAALSAWRAVKGRIDAESPSPHYAAYQEAIGKWDEVLTWTRQHGDEMMSTCAIAKLQRLRHQLHIRSRKPPCQEDLFDNHFSPEVRHPKLLAVYREVGKLIEPSYATTISGCDLQGILDKVGAKDAGNRTSLVVPTDLPFTANDPLQTEKAVWNDRLETMRRAQQSTETTVQSQVATFLKGQGSKVEAGQLTPGRRNTLTIHLNAFAEWIGGATQVIEISGQKLLGYRSFLLEQVAAGRWSMTTANERLASVKSLMRWLWRSEAIDSLPRIMGPGSQDLEIGKSQGGIDVFTSEELASMLNAASNRTRLYILLTLNTAMTQKDVADLLHSEVDWDRGRIARKRSKTRKFDATPVVSYQLWPETFKLLRSERNIESADRVLTNRNGSPLWTEGVDDKGRYQKVDNVRSAFERVRRKLGVEKPFKCLKKTSATEIAGSREYRSLRGLFLGHAPREISDRHYAQAPSELLDEAIDWLRIRLGINQLPFSEACSKLT